MTKYYKTIVTVTVLSADETPPEDLDGIAYQIDQGGMSGQVESVTTEINENEMRDALIAQNSDPSFLIPETQDQ